ncbi:MAG: DUF1223 domain-containing protein [Terriglobales bacterium]
MNMAKLTLKLNFLIAAFVLAVISFAGCRVALAADSPASGADAPVLVELFTSEGCSSCPPADTLLTKLDASQAIAGAQVIVLSEHVDYWDHGGWKDAYSSSYFTERQQEYVRRLGAKEPYTPEIVIDGASEMNGSNAYAVGRAIEAARGHVKVPVRLSSAALADTKSIRVHVAVDALAADSKARKAEIFVAVALDHVESHVSGGENKGRDIQHVAVAESISKVGTVEKGKNFDRDVVVKLKGAPDMGHVRLIAFVQTPGSGEVVGAALLGAAVR